MKKEDEKQKKDLPGDSIEGKVLQDVLKFISANDLSAAQIKKVFSKQICEWVLARGKDIPVSIFDNEKISILEAVVKFLKEEQGLRLKEIAAALNRNNKTIWTTYNNAIKKMPEPVNIHKINIHISIDLFKDRETSPLEVVVRYLKDNLGFKNHEIAKMLHRNQKTIWTTYNRKKI